jgi:hypothetical protein
VDVHELACLGFLLRQRHPGADSQVAITPDVMPLNSLVEQLFTRIAADVTLHPLKPSMPV